MSCLHSLPFHLHILDTFLYTTVVKPHCSNIRIITAKFSGCPNVLVSTVFLCLNAPEYAKLL